jgi:hypothetical protein
MCKKVRSEHEKNNIFLPFCEFSRFSSMLLLQSTCLVDESYVFSSKILKSIAIT